MSETAGLPQRNSLPGRLHLTEKRGNDMITFLLILCAVFMVGGFVAYNPLRRKMDGIIGVGGAYLILLGILMLFASIGQIAGTISGASNVSALEIILGIAVAVSGLGYMVIVMLSRCQTAGQRILLPFAAMFIGFGFCWRLLAAIFLHMPMESGKKSAMDEIEEAHDVSKMPSIIYDDGNNRWQRVTLNKDNATYRNDNGQEVFINSTEIFGNSANTSAGRVHW